MKLVALYASLAVGSIMLAAPAEAASAEKTNANGEKLVCKKFLETGSLVRKTKQCHTPREWDRIADSQRTGATKLVDQLSGRSLGGP